MHMYKFILSKFITVCFVVVFLNNMKQNSKASLMTMIFIFGITYL